jgi:hypothetical protein
MQHTAESDMMSYEVALKNIKFVSRRLTRNVGVDGSLRGQTKVRFIKMTFRAISG